jgi:serine protease
MQAAGSAVRRTGRQLRAVALTLAALGLSACDCDCTTPVADGVSGASMPAPPAPLFTCRGGTGPRLRAAAGGPPPGDATMIPASLDADLAAARAARAAWRDATFEQFLQSVRRECGPHGKYLVNGDVAIPDVKLLREFFDDHIRREPPDPPPAGRAAAVWPTPRKRALSYCVGSAFGAQHDKVVADMEAATGAWEQVANVDFSHVAAQDAACDAANDSVMFDVNPVDVGGAYLARAFHPGEPRVDRNVYVDVSALALDPGQPLQLAGVLRHALGHVLGFPHDYTRPESGPCFDDAATAWRSGADARLSVMHYPPCDGGTSWKLLLTDHDKSGAACVYGAAPGFSIDPAICKEHRSPMPPDDAPVLKSFDDQRVTRAALREYGPFSAKPGSLVRVAMKPRGAPSGDPDVYVHLAQKPARDPPAFTCRPFLTGALETCELDAGAPPNNLVRILVHGTTAGSYDLDVSFVPLAPSS